MSERTTFMQNMGNMMLAFLDKSHEFWTAIVGTALYLLYRDSGHPSLLHKMTHIIASILITLSVYESVSVQLNLNEVYVAIGIMVFGILILDGVTAVFKDKEFFKELIRLRFTGGKK